MSHTEKAWQNDGTNPYGTPQPKGNADDVWRRLTDTPCPSCGATSKRLTIDGNRATVTCL